MNPTSERLSTIFGLLFAACKFEGTVDYLGAWTNNQPLTRDGQKCIFGYASVSPRTTQKFKLPSFQFPRDEFINIEEAFHHLLRTPTYRTIEGMPNCIRTMTLGLPVINATTEDLAFIIEGLGPNMLITNNTDCRLTYRFLMPDFIMCVRQWYKLHHQAEPAAISSATIPTSFDMTRHACVKRLRRPKGEPDLLAISIARNDPIASGIRDCLAAFAITNGNPLFIAGGKLEVKLVNIPPERERVAWYKAVALAN